MIEKLMRDHPLVSFIVIPCAVIAVAGLFMAAIIFTISSATT